MNCPYCAERVEEAALECPHCHEVPVLPHLRSLVQSVSAMSATEKAAVVRTLTLEEGRQFARARRILARALENPALEADELVFCSKCGQLNPANNFKCTQCELELHGPREAPYVTVDASSGGLIPYRNAPALWAYYLGVFSLVPCLGIPLGLAGIILGIKGLSLVERRPDAKGKAHAWTGIVLGGLSLVLHVASWLVIRSL